MPEENNQKKAWKERIKETYRLVILKDDTLREVGSFRLTLLNLYILISSLLLTITLIIIALIIWTPLKTYVPGYANIHNNTEFIRVNKRIQDLEKQIRAYEVYTNSFKRVLSGNPETTEDINEQHTFDTLEEIDLSRVYEDELLRQEVESRVNEDAEDTRTPQRVRSSVANNSDESLEKLLLVPPLTGEISLDYQPGIKHYGIDILAPANTPVKSVLDGIVIVADWTLETGNTIGIQHNNNLVSFYKHNSALLKKVGASVKAGEAIAIIGNTGTHSDGPHLHFELWHNGKNIDPRKLIQFD